MTTATANRGYPIPQTSDAPQIPQDISALGVAVDTDIAAILTAYLTPVTDSSAGSAAAGFTDNGCYARTLANGKDVFVKLLLTNASSIPTSGGDFSDITCYTLDPPYAPTDAVNASMGTGHTTGEAILNSDGTVVLRSASDTIAAGSSIRITFRFIKAA